MSEYAQIPMQFVGPLKVSGLTIEGDYEVPLANSSSLEKSAGAI
jgi:hypothetical protein